MSPLDAAAAEEAGGEDEGADSVERDADRVDWNVDKTRVTGRLGRHDYAKRDQRQPGKLHARHIAFYGISTTEQRQLLFKRLTLL